MSNTQEEEQWGSHCSLTTWTGQPILFNPSKVAKVKDNPILYCTIARTAKNVHQLGQLVNYFFDKFNCICILRICWCLRAVRYIQDFCLASNLEHLHMKSTHAVHMTCSIFHLYAKSPTCLSRYVWSKYNGGIN